MLVSLLQNEKRPKRDGREALLALEGPASSIPSSTSSCSAALEVDATFRSRSTSPTSVLRLLLFQVVLRVRGFNWLPLVDGIVVVVGSGGGGEEDTMVGEEEAEWIVVDGDQCDFKCVSFLVDDGGVVEMYERCSRNFVARCCHCEDPSEDIVDDDDEEEVVGGGGRRKERRSSSNRRSFSFFVQTIGRNRVFGGVCPQFN